MITMTYLHPWTLRVGDEEVSFVPYAGNLRAPDISWEITMAMWLDGSVVSQESARYVSNFLCVFRVRPRDLDEDARSDEDIDDEELILTKHDLKEALKTRVGGHHTQGSKQAVEDGSKTSHEENSRQAMCIAQRTWQPEISREATLRTKRRTQEFEP